MPFLPIIPTPSPHRKRHSMSHTPGYPGTMTPQRRHHQHLAGKHKDRSRHLQTIDAQWTTYHRYIYRVCVDHLASSDDLVQFALTVATPTELSGLVAPILEQKDFFQLPPHAIAELEKVQTSPRRLRELCFRVARHNEAIHPLIVDYITDQIEITDTFPAVPVIVDEVARIFSLSQVEIRILMALYALEDVEALAGLMHQATHRTQITLIADAADTDIGTFVGTTAPGSTLERLGLIAFRGGRDEISDINVSRPLLFAIRSNTLDDLKAGLFDDTPAPQFQLTEFSISPEETRISAATVRGRYPLLITGKPGVGKTEFARTLIHALDRTPHTLATFNRHSEEFRPQRGPSSNGSRFNAIRMAANILSPATDVLIIDEADTILQSAAGFFGFFGGGPAGGTYDKGVLNDLLEHLPVATVWITNDHRMIPTSALRRFGHVLTFPHPTIDTRVRMLSKRLAPLAGHSSPTDNDLTTWTRNLAAQYDITPAAIDRTARIIAAELDTQDLSPADIRSRIAGYIQHVSTGALAHDIRRLPTVHPSFDPQFCCTSESLDRVERQALRRAHAGSGLRLLLGGPPGGGKTQYALYLAKRLGRDVVLKRPSDLLSKYVGESEQQIAAAFRAATQAGSVLIIDEADALLYDRSIAQRSWEHSQIAEFLQQIQDYTGILIACTNRVDAVDPALRRRFHKHLTFGPISAQVLPDALAHIFPEITFTAGDIAALTQGPPLMMSDLATAAEMLQLETDETTKTEEKTVVAEILANARSRDRTREIGFQ